MIRVTEEWRALEALVEDPRYMELPRRSRCNMESDVLGAATPASAGPSQRGHRVTVYKKHRPVLASRICVRLS